MDWAALAWRALLRAIYGEEVQLGTLEELVEFLVLADKWQVLSVLTPALPVFEARLRPPDASRLWEDPIRLLESVDMTLIVAIDSEFMASAEWLALGSGRLADAANGGVGKALLESRARQRRRCLGPPGVRHAASVHGEDQGGEPQALGEWRVGDAFHGLAEGSGWLAS